MIWREILLICSLRCPHLPIREGTLDASQSGKMFQPLQIVEVGLLSVEQKVDPKKCSTSSTEGFTCCGVVHCVVKEGWFSLERDPLDILTSVPIIVLA